MAIADRWSTRRLAAHVGIANTSLQRLLDDLALDGITVTDWDFDRAVIAMKAYKGGHTKDAIALLGTQPYIGSASWLVSGDGTAAIFSNLLQATAHIDAHPSNVLHLSPIGLLSTEAAA